ncbi:hypothetical protein LOK49_Contig541G00002 [Camellia lanceoleosa]|nr:hypothetical protein LOK49_Contig541G00002 [Camellia lanceoleosa]
MMSLMTPNSGQLPNNGNQFVQNMASLPSPPPKWINRPPSSSGMYYDEQHKSTASTYEAQVKKVYQVKGILHSLCLIQEFDIDRSNEDVSSSSATKRTA